MQIFHGAFAGLVFGGALAAAIPASAQGSPAGDTAAFGWKRQAAGLFNLSEAYYDNWAKGGTDALTWETNLSGSANLVREKFTWENQAKAAYGRTKIQDLDSRKSSDEWSLETIYTRKFGTWVNPFASGLIKSQFTAGYSYNDSALTRRQISDFFDPGYAMQTLGMGMNPIPDLKERLGATLKETFSSTYGYADDKTTPAEVETFKLEPGASSTTEYQRTLMENILATTRLDVFANFKGVDEIDADWTNKITAKVNKYVSANFELELMYDKDLSEDTQTRESFSVGIAFLKI
jgi:hypothetical protein